MENMFDTPIMKEIMDRYGHLEDLDELREAMRRDGLGPLVDEIDRPGYMESFIMEHGEEMKESLRRYHGAGTVAAHETPDPSRPLEEDEDFTFDPGACLAECDGRCCKGRNYLMLALPDIFNVLDSPAARHLKIFSTRDLFDNTPPLMETFFSEEYGLNLPHLRFLPVGAGLDVRPEEAESSICPFLSPMADVFSFFDLSLPGNTSGDAMGCMLGAHKPMVCRLSPVSRARGMVTGKKTYSYVRPARDCPGCASNVEIPLSSYINALVTPSAEKEEALFHEMIMAHHSRANDGADQKRFNSILIEFYNIDRLLDLYGFSPDQRPGCEDLTTILIAAAEGNFSLYDDFLRDLKGTSRAAGAATRPEPEKKAPRPDPGRDSEKEMDEALVKKIMETISGFHYSAEPFLEASKKMIVYEKFYEFQNFYFNGWQNQALDGAGGLCQHLSTIAFRRLSNLEIGDKKVADYYNVYYASGVYESKFFNWPIGNHICLIVFRKGETETGWVVDPSLKAVVKCRKVVNRNMELLKSEVVYKTDSDHTWLIPAKIGSSIRKHLEIKENAFTDYSGSFDTLLPLFVYQDESLVLAKFQTINKAMRVEYYEHRANGVFSRKTRIDPGSSRYKELYDYSSAFSIIDSLLSNVSFIDASEVDRHRRLASSELEEDYMRILYYIELAVVEIYREAGGLTDRIVANALKEMIGRKEGPPRTVEYVDPRDERMHRDVMKRIDSFDLESECPRRILINALKQVLGSVDGFIRQKNAPDAYLKFVLGYFK